MRYFFILLLGIFLLAGCSSQKEYVKVKPINPEIFSQKINYKKLQYQSEGSLWLGDNVRQGQLFADNRARFLGDVVTVIISEDISAIGSANTNVDGKNEDYYSLPYIGGKDASKWSRNWANFIKSSRENKFQGKGTTSRRNKINAVIAARVIEVLPNGNLRIAGRKYITINGERQLLYITGIIRPEDISFHNSIVSSKIADMQIEFTGRGILAAKQKRGWGAKILDAIWPF